MASAKTSSPQPEFRPTSIVGHTHRWAKSGVWARVMEALGGDADLEHLMIDSTVIRAHQHSAGAEKKQRSGKGLESRGFLT
jgi:transposase